MNPRYLLLTLLLIPCWVISFRYNVDLKVLHTVAQWLGEDWSRIYGETGASGRFFYGPVTVLFLAPLKELTYRQSLWVYGLVQTLSYVIFWWGLRRMTLSLWSGKKNFLPWVLLFVFAINPVHNNFQSGNIQLQLIALLFLAEQQGGFVGGMIASLPILVKVFPVLLLPYYFMTKKKPFFIGGVAGAIALHMGLAALSGWDGLLMLYRGFLSNITTYGQENSLLRIPDLLSLPSLFARWGLENLTVAVSGVLYALSLGVVWRLRATQIPNGGFALVMAMMAFINPSTRVHYFVFYVPLFALFCELACREKKFFIWVEVSAILLALAFTVEGVVGKHLNDTLEFWSVPTLGVLFLVLSASVRFARKYAPLS